MIFKFLHLLCVGIIIFILIFIVLEILSIFYIYCFMDEEKFGEYASIQQIINKMGKKQNFFKIRIHPYTGYIPTANYRKNGNRHNSYGFRGKDLKEKQENEIWIACIGESTTYDSDIQCWEKAYPAQLEKYLNEHGVKARVINVGVDGWTSFEIFIDFSLRVSRFPLDIVIYYGGLNDIGQTRFVYPVKANILERDITCARQGIAGMFNYPFWEESSIVRVILVHYGWAIPHSGRMLLNYGPDYCFDDFITQLARNKYPSGIFQKNPIEKIIADNPPIWFEHNIRNLVLLARSKLITPVLVKYIVNKSNQNDQLLGENPQLKQHVKKIISDTIVEINSVLDQVSKDWDVPLCDLPKIYPTDNPNMFLDLVHNSEQGAQIKAKMIGEFLMENQIVKRIHNEDK